MQLAWHYSKGCGNVSNQKRREERKKEERKGEKGSKKRS
jgi:hypothetical protein